MTTLLSGGTGFVGAKLIERLRDVVITTRGKSKAQAKLGLREDQVIQWNPAEESLQLPAESKFESVVNLMGEPIAEGRWNATKKKRIRESRVFGTRKLVDAIIESGHLPSVFVSASAIGIYGDSGEAIVDEQHDHGEGFLTDVCQEWEAETKRLTELGVRVVHLRIGIVLGKGGGAMETMVPVFKKGLGGRLGSGKQWMAWIHLDDLLSMIEWIIKTESVSGPVNATAPNPVRNSEFTKAVAGSLNRPAFFPAPKFALRLAIGEFADSLFFSQRVVPAAALTKGFEFKFPEIQSAVNDVIKSLQT